MLTNINSLASAGTTTVSLATGIAAIIVILALLGVYALASMNSWARVAALVLIVGILFVNVGFLHDIATSLRGWLNSLFVHFGANELVGNLTFALVLIGLFMWFNHLNGKSRQGDNKWAWLMVLMAFLFFTVSWAAAAIVYISDVAANLLSWTQHLHM